MKKILMILCLGTFIVSCNQEKTVEIQTETETTKTTKTTTETTITTETIGADLVKGIEEVIENKEKKAKVIFDERSREILKELYKYLQSLYKYSTELRYKFPYENEPLLILENNSYIFTTYYDKDIHSFIDINLENLDTKMILGNDQVEFLIDYEAYEEFIGKVMNAMISTISFNANKKMEMVILKDMPIYYNTIKIDSKVVLEVRENIINIIIKDKSNNLPVFITNIDNFINIEKNNNLNNLNGVIYAYSPKLLKDIKQLEEKYKRLAYLVKNSEQIMRTFNKEVRESFSFLDLLDYQKNYFADSSIKYYSSGRVKEIIVGQKNYKFEDKNNIQNLENLLTEAEKNLEGVKNGNGEVNKELILNLATGLRAEELNSSITMEEIEELIDFKEKVIDIYSQFDNIQIQ